MDNAIKEIVFDNQILNEDKMQYKNESKNDGDIKMTGINDTSVKSKENHVRGGTRKVYEEKDYSFRALLEDDELTSSITEDNSYDQLDELKEMCDQFDDNTNKGGECSNIDSPLISEEDKPELENQSSSSFSFTDVPSAQQSDKDVPYFDNETDDKNVDVQEALLRCVNFNYELLLSSYLQTHFLDNSESNLLKCMECSFETEKEDKFRSHLLTHSGTRAYLSFDDDDDFEMDGKSEFESHSTICVDEESVKCTKCEYETYNKSYMKIHMLVHSESKLFKCSLCSYKTNYKGHLNRHMLVHSDLKLFKCPECSYETNHKHGLKNHLSRHAKFKVLKCPFCDFETKDRHLFKEHKLTHTDSKLFRCDVCNYGTNKNSVYKRHVLIHSNSKLQKCSSCDFETLSDEDFKVHLLMHEDDSLSFNDTQEYDYEAEETNDDSDPISVPSEIEGYKCPKCSYQTKLKSYLKTHMLVHSDSKLFKCPDCQYETNYKSHLKRHSLTHSDVKLFDCPSCTFKTNRKSSLIAHLERHLRKLKS
ncbi:UNVERIFIED_CONTAM: hypothetical protein RMT77_014512 [Armadillidium vulgare]